MASNFALLLVSLFYVLPLVGAGTLVTYGFPLRDTLLKRLCLRFMVGAAVLPTILIALYEILGVRVHPACALAIGALGLVLLVHDEWRRRQAARLPAAIVEDARIAERSEEEEIASLTEPLEDLVLLLMMAGIFLTCYVAGTKYPLMEAWDPWGHAMGVRYIWDTGSLRQPFPNYPFVHYIDAYPPLYDILMSVPCWMAGAINAPLKLTNALFVAAIIPAFYLLVRDLSKDRRLAMVATILYAVMPSNLTRHVWGHSVAMVFTLAGLALAIRVRERWCWVWPGAICFAGALLAAPTAGIKAGVLLILAAAVALLIERRWCLRLVVLGTLALVLSQIWYLPVFMRYGTDLMTLKAAMDGAAARRKTADAIVQGKPEDIPYAKTAFWGATARHYSLDDYIIFRPYGRVLKLLGVEQKVDSFVVPVGIGLPVAVLCLIFLASCILRWVRGPDRIGWREMLLAWLAFAFIGVTGKDTGLMFFIWRFWLLFVPFAVIAAAEGLFFLAEAWSKSSLARIVFALCAVLFAVNAAMALNFDAHAPQYSPWPSFKDGGYPFLALILGVVLWLAIRLILTAEPANRKLFSLVTSVVVLDCIIAAPMRMNKLARPTSDHIFVDRIEYQGYVRTYYETPQGARIWPMAVDHRCQIIVGLDRICEPYKPGEVDFYLKYSQNSGSVTTVDLVKWLRQHGYEYVVLDPLYQILLTGGKPLPDNAFEKRVQELREMPGVTQVFGLPQKPRPDLSQFYLFKI